MTNDKRVLGRIGARILTDQEMNAVNGAGPQTGAPCSFDPKTGQVDGPVIDCG